MNIRAIIDMQMIKYTSLKEIGQVYIDWKAQNIYLHTTIDATTTSLSSPHPTLAQIYQNQNDDTLIDYLPLYFGNTFNI
jgi:hypothetical protein